jgi:hypothetical protein
MPKVSMKADKQGDTLVVESTGYNERTWLENLYPHTEMQRS